MMAGQGLENVSDGRLRRVCRLFDLQLIANVSFVSNRAVFGGGMYIAANPSGCANPDDCFPVGH